MKPKAKSPKVSPSTVRNASDINLVTWRDVSTVERCVSELLKDVEGIVSGEFDGKSSCAAIPLCQEQLVEDRRLVNWNRWLVIHEKESEKLSRSTYRRRQDLLVNLNPNQCRKLLTKKAILEKHSTGFGALNFWKLPGETRQHLHLTLPKSEQITALPEIVFTQTPDLVLKEQKIPRKETSKQVLKMIEAKIEEQRVNLFEPAIKHIALKGNANGDGLEKVEYENSKIESIQLTHDFDRIEKVERKQALVIQGLNVGSDFPDENILIELNFKEFKLTRQTKIFRFENLGEVAMSLSFTQSPSSETSKCFIFDEFPFRLIPGNAIDFEFHFHASHAGIFKEELNLVWQPAFSRQSQICIHLHGHCPKKYKVKDDQTKLEKELLSEEVDRIIKEVIELSVGECPPPAKLLFRDPRGIDFAKKNPKLFYDPQCVENLNEIFNELVGDDSEWNFDVDSLYHSIIDLAEGDKQKELFSKFLENFNQLRNIRRDSPNDESPAKFSMIRNAFVIFFDMFDEREAIDLEKSIKTNLCTTINKMINILES